MVNPSESITWGKLRFHPLPCEFPSKSMNFRTFEVFESRVAAFSGAFGGEGEEGGHGERVVARLRQEAIAAESENLRGAFVLEAQLHLALGAWCLALGAWCLVLGAWCCLLLGGGWWVDGVGSATTVARGECHRSAWTGLAPLS